MAEQKTEKPAAPDLTVAAPPVEPTKPAKIEKAEPVTELRFQGTPYSGHLVIGVEEFVVTDGKVSVPARLIDGARHAGFV